MRPKNSNFIWFYYRLVEIIRQRVQCPPTAGWNTYSGIWNIIMVCFVEIGFLHQIQKPNALAAKSWVFPTLHMIRKEE